MPLQSRGADEGEIILFISILIRVINLNSWSGMIESFDPLQAKKWA